MTLLYLLQGLANFSFYGLKSLLFLYLTQDLAFPLTDAFNLMAACLALSYGLKLVGGLIPQYLMPMSTSLRSSLFLTLVGVAGLASAEQPLLLPALAFFTIGSGLLRPLIPLIMDRLILPSNRQETYTTFYSVLNVGSFFGFVCCGAAGYFFDRTTAFYLPLIALSIAFFLSYWVKDFGSSKKRPNMYMLLLITLITLTILYFLHLEALWFVLPTLMIGTLLIYGFLYYQASASDKKALRTCFSYALCVVIFVALTDHASGSILVFIERVLRPEFIPAPALVALDPLFVILLAFWVKRNSFEISSRLHLGFLSVAGLFGLLLIIALTKSSFLWLIPVFCLLAFAELLVMPLCLERIFNQSPPHLIGFLAPLWSLAISYGTFLSGKSAALVFSFVSDIPQGFSLIYGGCLGVAVGVALFFSDFKKNISLSPLTNE